MLKIGFSTQFFTLWDVTVEDLFRSVKTAAGEIFYKYGEKRHYNYLRNLSLDEAAAKVKAAEFGCTDLEVDEQLRGHSSSWVCEEHNERDLPPVPYTRFLTNAYGLYNAEIASADYDKAEEVSYKQYEPDANRGRGGYVWKTKIVRPAVSALWITLIEAKNGVMSSGKARTFADLRRAVLCRAKLVEIGELVKVGRKHLTKKQAALEAKRAHISSLESGFHFTNGQRIELDLTLVDLFAVRGNFGETFIHTYKTEDNKLVKYVGASKPFAELGVKIRIKGTVQHSEYRGNLETKLQRIALPKEPKAKKSTKKLETA